IEEDVKEEEEDLEKDPEEDDDDDTAPMDSQPYEPYTNYAAYKEHKRKPTPPLIQNTMNRMIQESVEAAIRAEREREFKMKRIVREDLTLLQLLENVMMMEEFCPPEEIQRMECELWNLRIKEMDISSYITRFNELVILCPGMVPTERKKVEAYIRGLSKNIKGEVTSSEPATLNKAVRMAHTLMEQKVKTIAEREADNKKRKWENFQGGSSGGGNNNSNRNNNNCNSNRNYNTNRNNNQNHYRNTNRNHQNNQRQGNVRAMINVRNQNTNETGQNVKCNMCRMQHYKNCPIKCNKCGKIMHKARDCWSKVVATGANAQPIVTCYGCGEKGYIKSNCPARNNPGRGRARGQAYALRDGDQNLGPNVVMGTFLLNNCYARVLFDLGSDKSFVNINFSHLIDIELVKVDHSYAVELPDGRVVSTNTILRGCALNLVNHLFEFDLMPIELATLNKAVRMAHTLMEQKVKTIAEREADNKKRKWENFQGGSSGGGNNNSNRNNNNCNSNRNYNTNRNNNQNQYRNTNRNHQNNQRQGNVRAMINVRNQNTNETGQNVKCNMCRMQHYKNCPIKCNKCGKIMHKARDCWSKVVATGANAQPIVTCYGCGEKGYIKSNCPARNNPGR
nr:hypothetical protein [Tanacetum cinerariifolium]